MSSDLDQNSSCQCRRLKDPFQPLKPDCRLEVPDREISVNEFYLIEIKKQTNKSKSIMEGMVIYQIRRALNFYYQELLESFLWCFFLSLTFIIIKNSLCCEANFVNLDRPPQAVGDTFL